MPKVGIPGTDGRLTIEESEVVSLTLGLPGWLKDFAGEAVRASYTDAGARMHMAIELVRCNVDAGTG